MIIFVWQDTCTTQMCFGDLKNRTILGKMSMEYNEWIMFGYWCRNGRWLPSSPVSRTKEQLFPLGFSCSFFIHKQHPEDFKVLFMFLFIIQKFLFIQTEGYDYNGKAYDSAHCYITEIMGTHNKSCKRYHRCINKRNNKAKCLSSFPLFWKVRKCHHKIAHACTCGMTAWEGFIAVNSVNLIPRCKCIIAAWCQQISETDTSPQIFHTLNNGNLHKHNDDTENCNLP